jgi:hypothetical protein
LSHFLVLFAALEDPGGLDIVPLLAQADFYSGSLYPPESGIKPMLVHWQRQRHAFS